MLDFELPLVRGNITISDAIAEAVDSNKSGVLYEVQPGELRLVHYYSLLQAATTQQSSAPLKSVVFEPVLNVQTVSEPQIYSTLTGAKLRFGFKRSMAVGMARMFSVSEDYGNPFAVVAPGRRCTRRNKPAHIAPRDWYHYPPANADPNDPQNCAICGDPLQ